MVTVRTSETLDRLINGNFCTFYTVGTLEYTNNTESDSIMEQHGNTGNTGSNNKIDLTNVREVHVYHEDGSIKETFWFPITPPPPIVIEDSSDTETEEEEEEKQQEKKEEEKEKEDEAKEAEAETEAAAAEEEEEEVQEAAEEEEEEEEEEAEKAKEEEETEEAEEEEEEEEEEQENKRRRIAEPAPVRVDRSADNRSYDLTPLQPAPSMTRQEPEAGNELDPPLDIASPPSPLPELDVNMDIIAVMTEHGL